MLSLAQSGPIRRFIDAWFASRIPTTKDSILIQNNRLYILPTRFGYLFAVMLLFLFLAAINYQNSMAFILTFTLTALAILSLWQTHKNLLGVQIKLLKPKPVFCGQDCHLIFNLEHQGQTKKFAIGIQYANQTPVYTRIDPGVTTQAQLSIQTHRRGLFKPRAVTLFSRYPTGLFHAWSFARFDQPIYVYPKPMSKAKQHSSMMEQHDGQTSTNTIEGDDFAGLREHRSGESLRHISWKAFAQGKGLLTKTFQGNAQASLWIDWHQHSQSSTEDRLSSMTALILMAETRHQKYGLILPNNTIEQGQGSAHKHRCLHALSTFRQANMNLELDSYADST